MPHGYSPMARGHSHMGLSFWEMLHEQRRAGPRLPNTGYRIKLELFATRLGWPICPVAWFAQRAGHFPRLRPYLPPRWGPGYSLRGYYGRPCPWPGYPRYLPLSRICRVARLAPAGPGRFLGPKMGSEKHGFVEEWFGQLRLGEIP